MQILLACSSWSAVMVGLTSTGKDATRLQMVLAPTLLAWLTITEEFFHKALFNKILLTS